MTDIKAPFGQEKLKNFFFSLKTEGRILNSYIFEGAEGVGKETMVMYFCAHILCEKNPPCLKCNACKTLYANANPDVTIVSNESKSEIGVAKIRELVSDVFIRPQGNGKKIFIIKNAHLMNETAQNALLKVMEEPPDYAVFMLLCENKNKILPTILSRCTTITVPPLSKEEISSLFNENNDFLAAYSMGNPGRYISLSADEEFLKLREEFFEKIMFLADKNRASVYDLCTFFENRKDEKEKLFELLILFFGDVLSVKNFMADKIINADKINIINTFSEKTDKKAVVNALVTASDLQTRLGKYGAYSIYVNSMFIKLWEEING